MIIRNCVSICLWALLFYCMCCEACLYEAFQHIIYRTTHWRWYLTGWYRSDKCIFYLQFTIDKYCGVFYILILLLSVDKVLRVKFLYYYLKWSGSFFLNHNKSFRWHLGDYEKHNFYPFEGLWEEKLSFLCVLTDV